MYHPPRLLSRIFDWPRNKNVTWKESKKQKLIVKKKKEEKPKVKKTTKKIKRTDFEIQKENWESALGSSGEQTTEIQKLITPSKETLKNGVYGIVQFESGKKCPPFYKYAFVVDDVDWKDDEVKITCLNCTDDTKKNFLVNDKDRSFVQFVLILGLLPNPDIGLKVERIFYKFKQPLDILEKW
jgi:hypothetical protein